MEENSLSVVTDSNKTADLERMELSVGIPFNELKFGQELGRGGFGIVYLGVWRGFDVAIKKLCVENLTEEQEREFKAETYLMARLRSPNVVQFYGVSVDKRPFCIVMQNMEKGSLYDVLKDQKIELPWSLREKIALDVAKGLSFLHHENILHRDLKSMNVLLDTHMQAKLGDFGLAKIKLDPQTFVSSEKGGMGTPYWMAPELFDPDPKYSKYSDVYSYGITLWELAARKIPYSSAVHPAIAVEWVKKGKREEIPKDCPPKLASLISFCWNQAPRKRPLTDKILHHLKEAPIMDDAVSSGLPKTDVDVVSPSSQPRSSKEPIRDNNSEKPNTIPVVADSLQNLRRNIKK